LLVAVPLKHAFGYALATRIMGPIHGAAFIAYAWSVVATVSAGGWSRAEIARLIFAAFVPFGGFINVRMLRRRQAELAATLEVSRADAIYLGEGAARGLRPPLHRRPVLAGLCRGGRPAGDAGTAALMAIWDRRITVPAMLWRLADRRCDRC
jgi:integral membrane protein